MSFTPFYFSPQFPSLESEVVVRGRSWEQPGLDGGGIDMDLRRQPHAVEFDVDFFCPFEHPMEPPDEDRPVKCPMSAAAASSSIDYGKGREGRVAAESSRKRSEQPTTVNNGIVGMAMTEEPPIRAVRKRHHTLTRDNHIKTEPFITKPSLPPIPPHTLTTSQMLNRFDQV
ncbi:uncharacterized protein LOC120197702 [Hibiscus syriacus]|uniref:uncharacterized protein LOC120197702 n=1 Tax=Hibiscus syriacus TaxID=106335 RepID=UPI0019207011|nr:uncharacterized protein LOC120197702 [Hibiscus syriacus]